VEDRFGPIIHRNTTLPTTRGQVFSALYPDQRAIRVKVYQGENPIASQNTLLGEFLFEDLEQEIEDLPPRITVQFDLDMNGILNVSAADRGSGQAKQTTLQAAHTRLSPNDRAAASQRIDELWQTGAAVTGDPLLQRAKAWVQNEEEQVHELADLVQRLEAAEREGDLETAARWREELTDLLYDLEGAAGETEELHDDNWDEDDGRDDDEDEEA